MTNSNRKASGTLLVCNDTSRFLLAKRGTGGSNPGTWAIVSGAIDTLPNGELEKPLVAAIRELDEETEIKPDNITFKFYETQTDMGGEFHLFLGYCGEELECNLNDENTDWGWFDMESLPSPLFPTLKATLLRIF
tara:strand:+ start:1179 stop:1583 length:405 start_codon:yes stop_codon:yes gene_type:complete